MHPNPIALIAEDEPLLARALQIELSRAWPELQLLPLVCDGASAVAQALQAQPDVLFFDIRMPGMSGLEAAVELAETWDLDSPTAKAFPVLVFVTAYDQYAVQAFEAQALDYLLKPVQPERLRKTVSKVRLKLQQQAQDAHKNRADSAPETTPLDSTLAQLRHLLTAHSAGTNQVTTAAAKLQHIQASVGSSIRLIALTDVVYFEAADKYLRVLTQEREYLIRTPLKELLPQLDNNTFWQIHRGTVVNTACIDSVSRDEAGKFSLKLNKRTEKLPVSRLYAYLFKAM
jgi:DNA-binding LytR/AlgR family response regulator